MPGNSSALNLLLRGNPVPAQDLLADPVDRPARVLQIARKALENLEEKGLQTLYLGIGFATWTADDGGRDAKSPIFLLPLSFKVKGRDLSAVEVRVVGEPQVNPVLIHVLQNAFNIKVSAEDLLQTVADPDGDAETSAQSVSVSNDNVLQSRFAQSFSVLLSRAGKVPGFATDGSAVISNFAFQKLAMVNDIKESSALLAENDIVAAIAGDLSARTRVGSSQISIDPRTLDANPPDKEFCVVEADSSQQCAISGIASGQSAVVHGPPGTGKSQTITNLIATLVGNGKTVLFVAEKRAALEVVQKRLTASGLDHLAIDLHGAELTSKKVMERIARTLGTIRDSRPPEVDGVHRQFVERRAKLNKHDQRMHAPSQRTGKTVYEMQGALLRLPPSAMTTVRWRSAELACITPAKAEEVRDLLREAGGFESLFTRTDASPWTGRAFQDGKAVQQAIDAARQLAYEELPSLGVELRELVTSLGFRTPRTLDEIGEVSALLKKARELLDRYDSTIFSADISALLAGLSGAKDGGLKALWLTITSSSFRKVLKQAIQLRKSGKATAGQVHAELVELLKTSQHWKKWSMGDTPPIAYPGVDSLFQKYTDSGRNALLLQSIMGQSRWEQLESEDLARLSEALAQDNSTPYLLLQLTQIEGKLKANGVQRLVEDLRQRNPSHCSQRINAAIAARLAETAFAHYLE